MKILIAILLISLNVNSATYYLAPTTASPAGSDANSGAIGSPWFTLEKAWTVVAPGDIIYMRGGTYVYTTQQYLIGENGTSGNLISIFNYPGEVPALTRHATFSKGGSRYHKGFIFLTANYTHWKGIEIYGMYTDDNQVDAGIVCIDANNNIFEMLNCHNNVEGISMQDNSTGNLFKNCDFHDNYDAYGDGGNSDGLQIYYTNAGTTNTVTGCRAWNNADDGFDTYENGGTVNFDSCWAWHNGFLYGTETAKGNGVGFKFGSDFLFEPANHGLLRRTMQNCIAYDNRDGGVHINGGDYICRIDNSTFYANRNTGFNLHYANNAHIMRNVISTGNTNKDVELSGASSTTTCSAGTADNDGGWPTNASSADFVSVDGTQLDNTRESNGSLPTITFLHLVLGSDMINTGTDIGRGNDKGAFEYTDPLGLPNFINRGRRVIN